MMFTYEMPLSLPGLDAFVNVEDDVVVTEDGVENMNAMLSREMRVKLR
jgi:Xaa-Pro aminopeptidase